MSLRVLMLGVVGPDVQAWQAFLAAKGINPGPIDGIFGAKTRQATITFQAQHGLSADGIAGKNTFAKAAELGFVFETALMFTQPNPGSQFALGEAVEFAGLAAPEIVRVELSADDQFVFPTVTLAAGQWDVANRLRVPGRRDIVARGFNAAGELHASDTLTLFVSALDFGSLVPIPAGINKGLSPASPKLMLDVFGKPGQLSDDCTVVTSDRVKRLLTTSDVGPFSITGIRPAVAAITRVFARVAEQEPELLNVLGTAGMLCCRRVKTIPPKPKSKNFSNHSWGTAIDIKIRGTLDPRGDGKTQLGLVLLNPFFHEEKFFWGAGFDPDSEDSMHFEASAELIKEWQSQGLLNT